jgi:RNA polymerase sigma-70 factor, ECF subfamily
VKGREEVRSSDFQEAEAIRQAQRGDANAFEQLYRLHSRRVFALCLRMLKNTAEAEDLTQEAFLTVFRAIHTFRGHSAFSSWLHRVTVDCVLMHLRRKALTDTSLEEIIRSGEDSGSTRKELRHFDLRLKGLIDRLSIQKAVAQLPARLKGTVLYGCEHREIAEILACSTGTSKSRLHKARRRLRELLPSWPPSGTRHELHSMN